MGHANNLLQLSLVIFVGTLLSSHALLGVHCSVSAKAKYANTQRLPAFTTERPVAIETSTSRGSACRKLMMIMAKRTMKHMNSCGKELKETYPDKEGFQKHFQCTLRCYMLKVDMVDKEYRMSNQTLENFITGSIPERYQELMRKTAYPCLQEFGSKLDAADEYCLQHGEFSKCVQLKFAETC